MNALFFPGPTMIRSKSRQKIKLRSNAPKVKRNETMKLSDRKHFAAMIRSGAKYREVLKEHLRIFKKTIWQVFKSIYASWLMKKYVEVGPENVTMEQCILSYASIFNGLDVRVINNGFKKTKIEKFQSEETLEIEISREEQLMNIIERMEKFRCDDSDDE